MQQETVENDAVDGTTRRHGPPHDRGRGRRVILEGIVTTRSLEGVLNVAPMGPLIDEDMSLQRFVLRPYRTSTTYRNLKDTGEGIFHVTDDVLLLAQAAIGAALDPPPELLPATSVSGWILANACRYHEFRVVSLRDNEERTTIDVETVAKGHLRDFFGFNRARHAVLEAAILATRTAFLPSEEILPEFEKLAVLVRKTGGASEEKAFHLLHNHVLQVFQSVHQHLPTAGS